MPLLPIIIGSIGAFACLIAALWFLWRKRLIEDLPTSKTQGVFVGLAELKGTAESETPLTSYLAGIRCVQYASKIDEHWSRTVVETYTDSKGHTQTRTRTESGWTKVAGDEKSIPFYLKDDAGIVRIVPEMATIHGITAFNETCSRDNPLYFSKGPSREISNSTHRRRFVETSLPLHTMLYLVGQARERQDVVAAEIAYDKDAPMFLVSTRTEKQLSTGYNRWFWFWAILGAILAVGSAILWRILQYPGAGLDWRPYVIGGVAFIFALMLGWVWTVYNSLINLHHRVEQGWSQVDVQLERRFDLIPNLIKTIEGYRTYEKEIQQLLAEIRAQSEATPPGVAGPDFKGISLTLQTVIERYPDLKASESFLKLQQSLQATEQRIALARDYFNEIATFYNTRLEIIPDRFVAGLARLHTQALMSATDFERAHVNVELAS